ncbi:MAG: phosphopyruvate hydratase [Bdellovibrionales bacterium CG10_big_fil_rev_8_21_14_0_10_45_34]|nr:MAG: phosphopyruvate hydratase [Bdellovibrionales bacterium CG10_big_fil_rev_8_21_14_0_10_45_34]
MSKITLIHGREILDSRGNPTVEVEVTTKAGVIGRAAVPSGASTGAHEACELRDQDKTRYLGKGVLKAVANVNTTIAKALVGFEVSEQKGLDHLLLEIDGTENKSNLGANSLLGVSLACARAASLELGQPLFQYVGGNKTMRLPTPLMNVVNGGAHADNGLDVQEFMVVPKLKTTFAEALRTGAEIFHNLKKILSEKKLATAVGDEGGFAPKLDSNQTALDLLMNAIEKAGYQPGEDVSIALDVAATELFEDGSYRWEGNRISSEELVSVYSEWSKKYPITSIEDGLSEDDWSGWKFCTDRLGSKVQLVGDDLFVTNVKRIQRGIQDNIANAVLIKVNQIGTLSETMSAVELAHSANYGTVMSHRSGETEDTTIADLSVALGCHQIKTGSLCRSERIAKYNQLLRIEEMLSGKRN